MNRKPRDGCGLIMPLRGLKIAPKISNTIRIPFCLDKSQDQNNENMVVQKNIYTRIR